MQTWFCSQALVDHPGDAAVRRDFTSALCCLNDTAGSSDNVFSYLLENHPSPE